MSFKSLTFIPFLSLTMLLSCEGGPQTQGELTVVSGKGIIGQDDRQSTSQIGYVRRDFINRVGQLITRDGLSDHEEGRRSYASCTASLVAKNFIITAAHCAFDKDYEYYKDQFFYPGIQKEYNNPNGKFRVKRVFMPLDFDIANPSSATDIAIMELDKNQNGDSAGSKVGTLGYWGKELFPDGPVITVGYPGDKEDHTQHFQDDCRSYGDSWTENRLRVDCDIFQGQSGSPIFVYSKEYESYYIHGVVTSESPSINFGSHLSKERMQIIKHIIMGAFNSDAYHSQNFQERWVSHTPPKSDIINVFVKNTCSNQDLYLAIRSKKLNGEWITDGYFTLRPFQEKRYIKTTNGIYYLSARRKNGRRHTANDISKYLPKQGENIPFQKFNSRTFGYKTHTFGCN